MDIPMEGETRAAVAENAAAPKTFVFGKIEQHDLLSYWQSFWRRKWIAIAIVVAAIIAALLFTFSQPVLYRATTTIEISRETARVLEQKDTQEVQTTGGNEFFQTQYGLLKSRSLIERVVRELRLADNETFLNGYGGSIDAATTSRPERERAAVGLLSTALQIMPTRNSGLVDISVDSAAPDLSARIANTIAQDFIKANLERRFDANAYARNFLESELGKVRKRLEDSERDVVNYAANRQLIELNRRTNENGDTVQGQSLAEIDLDILNRKLAEARANRIAAEAQLGAARRAGNDSSTSLADPAIAQLRARRAELQGEYSKNLATLKPDYPPMVALKQQIDQLNQQITRQSTGVNRGLQSQFETAATEENELAAQVAKLRGSVTDLGRDRIQYNIYQREADTNRALYDSLLERYKEIGVAGSVGTNNIAIVDPALPPPGPFTPRLFLNLFAAILIGSIAGVAAAILFDRLDDALRNPADIDHALGTPLLGVIPYIEDDDRVEQLRDPKSLLSESFMAAQMSLRFATDHGVPKSLAFTSANPNEGKTTASLAVATVLAKMGSRVLLLDGDMRNPSIHKIMGMDNNAGLSDILSGGRPVSEVIRPGGVDNLSVITSGPIPPNPAELLGRENLARLRATLERDFDHVIFDAAPVIGLSDAPALASAVEATVFVVAADQTHARTAVASLRRLLGVNANVLGTLLMKFKQSSSGYGYNYEYRYEA